MYGPSQSRGEHGGGGKGRTICMKQAVVFLLFLFLKGSVHMRKQALLNAGEGDLFTVHHLIQTTGVFSCCNFFSWILSEVATLMLCFSCKNKENKPLNLNILVNLQKICIYFLIIFHPSISRLHHY